jgi:hypothetical protein
MGWNRKEKISSDLYLPVASSRWYVEIIAGQYNGRRGQVISQRTDRRWVTVRFRCTGKPGKRPMIEEKLPIEDIKTL